MTDLGCSSVGVASVSDVRAAVNEQSDSPRVVDTRGHSAWLAHHLPGSFNLSPDMPPTAAYPDIAVRLGFAGIAREDHLLLYDDGSGARVGPMVWLLDRVAHRRVTILDGGIMAWHSDGQPLHSGPDAAIPAVPYDADVAALAYENLATKQWILGNMTRKDVALLDTRSEDEYRGRGRGARRGGHIPGAVWLEWSDTLVDAGGGVPRFATPAEITPRLTALGIDPDKEIVCYCQSGRRSAQVYGVLRALGYARVRNYLGSWGEWGSDPNAPVEKG